MDLLRHAKYVLADQFQVQKVDEQFLCVLGPFVLEDGQYLELYLREVPRGLELIFFPGLTEVLTLEAMHGLARTPGTTHFKADGVELDDDRLSLWTERDRLLEDLMRFAALIQGVDRHLRASVEARSRA